MVEYFAELINKVDLACEEFLIRQEDETTEISRQIRNDQTEMVKKIKDHEMVCLDKLPENEIEEELSRDVMEKIRDIGLRLEGEMSEGQIWEMDLEIGVTLLLLQRRIFNDKGIWFLTGEDFEMTCLRYGIRQRIWKFKREDKESYEFYPFGFLVAIEDLFLLREDLVEQ